MALYATNVIAKLDRGRYICFHKRISVLQSNQQLEFEIALKTTRSARF